MVRAIGCVAILLFSLRAGADEAAYIVNVDAREFAVSFARGRVHWRIAAQDALQLALYEPFAGIELDGQSRLTQQLADSEADLDGERRLFLTVTIGW